MSWQEVTFSLSSADIDDYEDALMSLGAMSITLRDAADQPLLEPPPQATPVWDQVRLTAMFEATADITLIVQHLQQMLAMESLPDYEVAELADREWRRSWMDYFQPMRFGQRLWICPSGYEPPGQEDAVIVDLDPGLAFGTGSHPTTALCMQWLDSHELTNMTLVDFGCGSGVLAIAAAKLGAARVYAVDNDPQALQATAANAEANQVGDTVTVIGPEDIPPATIDILIANILLGPLLALQDEFHRQLKPSGQLVLSGLLQEQRSQLETAYRQNFAFETCEQLEEWVRLTATHC